MALTPYVGTIRVHFHGCDRTVNHPESRRPLTAGDSFLADEAWITKRAGLFDTGVLTRDEPKKAPAKKKAAAKK